VSPVAKTSYRFPAVILQVDEKSKAASQHARIHAEPIGERSA